LPQLQLFLLFLCLPWGLLLIGLCQLTSEV
jgi:hypothetical protein